MSRPCRHCGRPFTPEPKPGRPPACCSDRCRTAYVKAKHAAADARRAEKRRAASPAQPPDPVAAIERKAGKGRNPATSEVEYAADEVEFLRAVERFKRDRKKPFPALTELLAVLKSLGYRKPAPTGAHPGDAPCSRP